MTKLDRAIEFREIKGWNSVCRQATRKWKTCVAVVVHNPTHWTTLVLDGDNLWSGPTTVLDSVHIAIIEDDEREF